MELIEALKARHSVRQYLDKPIEGETLALLEKEIAACNEESGLNFKLMLDENKAFDCMFAHYGKFKNAKNYIVLKGKTSENFEEACGYFGQRLVLFAQQIGLNTCWVAGSYNKKIPDVMGVEKGEELAMIIAVGYGENEGKPHKSKKAEDVSNVNENSPEWFKRGVEAALLAPTAINQQKFFFRLEGDKVAAKCFRGFYVKTDLGIAKYCFEVGAGKDNVRFI